MQIIQLCANVVAGQGGVPIGERLYAERPCLETQPDFCQRCDWGVGDRDRELHFDSGEKLLSRFAVFCRNTDGRGWGQWLLIHRYDDHAKPEWGPEKLPGSGDSRPVINVPDNP